MEKRCKIKIYGKVQGVGFRYFVKRNAEGLNLFGFVRNEPDGCVYVDAEGEQEKLQELAELCDKGPRPGLVDRTELSWSDELANYSDFEIEV